MIPEKYKNYIYNIQFWYFSLHSSKCVCQLYYNGATDMKVVVLNLYIMPTTYLDIPSCFILSWINQISCLVVEKLAIFPENKIFGRLKAWLSLIHSPNTKQVSRYVEDIANMHTIWKHISLPDLLLHVHVSEVIEIMVLKQR